jgi:hypothetical protein
VVALMQVGEGDTFQDLAVEEHRYPATIVNEAESATRKSSNSPLYHAGTFFPLPRASSRVPTARWVPRYYTTLRPSDAAAVILRLSRLLL